jgi:hypothetical protein
LLGAVTRNEQKITKKTNTYHFCVDFNEPVAIETLGIWGEQAIELVKEIGRRYAASTHEPRSTAFLDPTALVISSRPAWQRLLRAGDTSHIY